MNKFHDPRIKKIELGEYTLDRIELRDNTRIVKEEYPSLLKSNTIEKVFRHFDTISICVNLINYLKEKGFKYIVDLPPMERDSKVFPIYSQIEIDKRIYKYPSHATLIFSRNEIEYYAINIEIWERQGLKESNISFMNFEEKFVQELIDNIGHNSIYKNKKINSKFSSISRDLNKYSYDKIILSQDIIDKVNDNILNFYNNIELYKKYNIKIKRGIIFSGEPGTGKTLLVKIIANNFKGTVIYIEGEALSNSDLLKEIWDICRVINPTLIIMEDIDLFLKERGMGDDTLLNSIMTLLDGIQENEGIFTIATTNNLLSVENAIKNRPGRFDITINFPLPDEEIRKRMIENFISDKEKEDLDIDEIVVKTKGLSGAYIQELINLVCIKSIDREKRIFLRNKYFDECIPLIKKKDKKIGLRPNFDIDYDI